MGILIQDRVAAGRDLAQSLVKYRKQTDVVVLGLPRGGVPVAAEIASALHAPLDLIVVRKLGTPGHEELAMGAIATGGIRVLNRDVVSSAGITEDAIERVAARAPRALAILATARRERRGRSRRGLAARGLSTQRRCKQDEQRQRGKRCAGAEGCSRPGKRPHEARAGAGEQRHDAVDEVSQCRRADELFRRPARSRGCRERP